MYARHRLPCQGLKAKIEAKSVGGAKGIGQSRGAMKGCKVKTTTTADGGKSQLESLTGEEITFLRAET